MLAELMPYVCNFYLDKKNQESFNRAWNHHLKWNKHHWQYWVLILDDGGSICLPIPEKYIREMVADWLGASRAIAEGEGIEWTPNRLTDWYNQRRATMKLEHTTRIRVETLLQENGCTIKREASCNVSSCLQQ